MHTLDNDFKSLIDLSIGYYPQGGTLYASPIITIIMQYSKTCKLLPVFLFIYRLAFSFYTCIIISHKFVLASLRKPYGFFSGFWWEAHSFYFWANLGPKLLYIKTNDPKIDPKGPWSFTNFVIPLHATYIRHSQDKCWNLLLKFECH